MTTPLTRDEVNEVMGRHNDRWPADNDFSPTHVREYAKYLRGAADFPGADYNDNMVQAAELDALVDRIEQEEAA
jgi:hypothetical protein